MNLSLTFSFDPISMYFLDISLVGDESRCVVISPYRKNMARNATLLATAGGVGAHKKKADTFSLHQEEVCDRLRARSYPE